VGSQVVRVARYRFRVTLGHRWGGYLTTVVLIGLLGGLAMGSIAAARRTQSSFPQYIAATDPFQLSGVTAEFIPGLYPVGYDPTVVSKIGHLRHVTGVGSLVGLNVAPIEPNGAIKNPAVATSMTFVGALQSSSGTKGEGVSLVSGRLPRATAIGSFAADEAAVRKLHLRLGKTVTFGVYTNAQTQLPGIGTAAVQPVRRVTGRLVGIITTPQNVVKDDIDASTGNVVFTPAFARPLLKCCTDFTLTDVAVRGGSATIAMVGREALRLVPHGSPPFTGTASTVAKAERAIKPESIALGAFGAIVALAALLIAGQLIGRQLRTGSRDTATMRALGANPAMTAADGLLGIFGEVVVGALLAAVVAVGLSPLAPLGPVRPFYPTPGVAVDWVVLGLGVGFLVIVLGGISAALAYRYLPHRMATRSEGASGPGSRLASSLSTGLPAPALVGVRFAVSPGRGADPVPVRSVIFGSVLALIVVTATAVFGASLNSLVSHPSLYGWNWNYELASEFGSGNIPQAKVASLLERDPDVAAWSGAYFETAMIDGQIVPIVGQRPGSRVAPPTLTGHGLERTDQIVLGAVTLASLHKHIGDTVAMQIAIPGSDRIQTTHLHIVGSATMPTIGQGTSLHLEMGTGAVVPYTAIPAVLRDSPTASTPNGPDAIFVRLKSGVIPASALPQLRRIATATGNLDNDGVVVASVEHPAEIVNYKTLGATPTILGATLAAGAVAGLGLMLVASVRRRRRDLALLKTLGFTKRQLAAVVACQASVAVSVGVVVGVPLGIALGRYLWSLFATDIHAVPAPLVSAQALVLIVLGAIGLANLVALVPGWIAARTPIAPLLRSD
jgi:hypothetical protein